MQIYRRRRFRHGGRGWRRAAAGQDRPDEADQQVMVVEVVVRVVVDAVAVMLALVSVVAVAVAVVVAGGRKVLDPGSQAQNI